jgi:hypothetical protein
MIEGEYILGKFSRLFLEISEFPQKREILYTLICFCRLSERFLSTEVPLYEIENCLRKFLIDPVSYRLSDYLLELEIFKVCERSRIFEGKELLAVELNSDDFLCLKREFIPIRRKLCEKFFLYWRVSQRADIKLPPTDAGTLFENTLKLLKEGLHREVEILLDENISLLSSPEEILTYRVLKLIAEHNRLLEGGGETREVLKQLFEFLNGFRKELPKDILDIGSLKKQIRRNLKGKEKISLNPERPKKGKLLKLGEFFLNLFKLRF